MNIQRAQPEWSNHEQSFDLPILGSVGDRAFGSATSASRRDITVPRRAIPSAFPRLHDLGRRDLRETDTQDRSALAETERVESRWRHWAGDVALIDEDDTDATSKNRNGRYGFRGSGTVASDGLDGRVARIRLAPIVVHHAKRVTRQPVSKKPQLFGNRAAANTGFASSERRPVRPSNESQRWFGNVANIRLAALGVAVASLLKGR